MFWEVIWRAAAGCVFPAASSGGTSVYALFLRSSFPAAEPDRVVPLQSGGASPEDWEPPGIRARAIWTTESHCRLHLGKQCEWVGIGYWFVRG